VCEQVPVLVDRAPEIRNRADHVRQLPFVVKSNLPGLLSNAGHDSYSGTTISPAFSSIVIIANNLSTCGLTIS
jgi:hypothetical protein